MPDELDYVLDAVAAVALREYEDAIRLLINGLEKNLKSDDPPEAKRVLGNFYGLMLSIEKCLEVNFGVKLREIAKDPEHLPLECGFCGKTEKDDLQIVYGLRDGICSICCGNIKVIFEDLTLNGPVGVFRPKE